jgi:hypothetical protein
MITMNPPTIPIPAVEPATLQTLSEMVTLLSDPAASKARVAEMLAATAALQKAVADQKASIAAFIIAEAENRSTLDQQAAEAAAKMAALQTAFDTECIHRKQLLDEREASLTELQSEAAADAIAAKAARADYERRLAIIKSATG